MCCLRNVVEALLLSSMIVTDIYFRVGRWFFSQLFSCSKRADISSVQRCCFLSPAGAFKLRDFNPNASWIWEFENPFSRQKWRIPSCRFDRLLEDMLLFLLSGIVGFVSGTFICPGTARVSPPLEGWGPGEDLLSNSILSKLPRRDGSRDWKQVFVLSGEINIQLMSIQNDFRLLRWLLRPFSLQLPFSSLWGMQF